MLGVVISVIDRLYSAARLEHQLENPIHFEHSCHFWKRNAYHGLRIYVLDGSVTQDEVEGVTSVVQRPTQVCYMYSIGDHRAELPGDADVFLHHLHTDYVVAVTLVVEDVPGPSTASGVQTIPPTGYELL